MGTVQREVALRGDPFADLIRKSRDYTLNGIAEQIAAPTLIMDGENDQFLKGQPQLVEKALTGAKTTLVTLIENEGPASTPMRVPC